MRNLIILLFIFYSHHILSNELASCQRLGIVLKGNYLESDTKIINDSPLLDVWSEESGNLVSIKITYKQNFSKLKILFEDKNHKLVGQKEWNLKKNQVTSLDFSYELKKFVGDLEYARFQLFLDNSTPYCYHLTELVKNDGIGVAAVIQPTKQGKKK